MALDGGMAAQTKLIPLTIFYILWTSDANVAFCILKKKKNEPTEYLRLIVQIYLFYFICICRKFRNRCLLDISLSCGIDN